MDMTGLMPRRMMLMSHSLLDRPAAGTPDDTTSSANHNARGQNVVYIDGHVEFVNSPLAGWFASDGTTRDNIYTDNTSVTSGTDTYILHDG